MPTHEVLLTSKLALPPWRPHLVRRPRLAEAIAAVPAARLILFSAPAGFGKTTALVDWCRQQQGAGVAVAWCTLEAGDNDPVRFVAYVTQALAGALALAPEDVDALVAPLAAGDLEARCAGLVQRLAQHGGRVILALDDFHTITAPAVHGLVNLLLRHLPSTTQLAIGSRADPPLGLARLRVRGELAEVRAADLAFSAPEVAQFLRRGTAVPAEAGIAESLAEWTEGWAAGLQLAALALGPVATGPGAAPAAETLAAARARAAGSRRHVFEYLAEEVLAHQPPDVQDFLLDTSVLERLSAGLCAAVTGRPDSAAVLAQLDAGDLFLTALDAGRHWYRYHHLFAEFLRARLDERHPGRAPELHRRAARWFAAAGADPAAVSAVTAAVDHALAGQDYDFAARLFVEQAWLALTARAEVATILRWAPLFPATSLAAHPELPVYFARACFIASLPDEAESWFRRAGRILDELPSDYPGAANVRGLYLSYRAALAAYRGDLRAGLDYAHAAAPLIPTGDSLAEVRVQAAIGLCRNMQGDVDGAQRAYGVAYATAQAAGHLTLAFDALHHLAVADIYRGRLRAAARRCEDALAAFPNGERRVQPVGMGLIALAHVHYHWNDLRVSEALLAESLDLARRSGHADMGWIARLYLVPVKCALGDAVALEELAKILGSVARSHPSRFLASNLAATRAAALLTLGDIAEARRWAEEYLAAPAPEFRRENEELVLARVLLASRETELALGRLRTGRELAETAGRHGRTIEFQVLEAQALSALGRFREALASLRPVLERAAPEGYVRVFVDDWAAMRPLLAAARAEGIAPEYVARLLTAGAGDSLAEPGGAGAEPLGAGLSPRELEILRLIASGATNRDVAAALVVTVGTVKSHLNRLMGKLGARNRTEAVAKARALGLIP
jgi:LuxR family maltose regulon positive regulatory protein